MKTTFLLVALTATSAIADPIIIAHRGACGYLPEHTLEAAALAYGQGADCIEQDIVLTKDNVPIVLHDIHLDTVTDVAKVFPRRARKDKRYYAIDFTLAEIKRLRVSERVDIKTGKVVFPRRFPAGKSEFRIPTLAEEIELIQGMNKATGKTVGIYPEVKKPDFHRGEKKDISRIVLSVLTKYGYTKRSHRCFLQCFDPLELRRIRVELKSDLKLVLLLEKAPPKPRAKFLQTAKKFFDGIGPDFSTLYTVREGKPVSTGLVAAAKKVGLVVHPWTFRRDQRQKPFRSFEEVHRFGKQLGIDGVFTDHPDLTRKHFAR